MAFEVLFAAIYGIAAALALWSRAQLLRFLADTPEIADNLCLDRYKALVRVQMYLALAMIVLLVAGMVVAAFVIKRNGVLGFAVAILANVLVLGLGLRHRTFEVKARTLHARSQDLAGEYRRVSDTWLNRPLPDF